MPIYEYHCQKCGIIEITQKITDKALSRCPKCKGKIKKLISHTSFQLKGTGWYATDYARKDNKDNKDNKESGAKEKKAPAVESKSETPSAAEKSSTEKKTAKPAASGSSAD